MTNTIQKAGQGQARNARLAAALKSVYVDRNGSWEEEERYRRERQDAQSAGNIQLQFDAMHDLQSLHYFGDIYHTPMFVSSDKKARKEVMANIREWSNLDRLKRAQILNVMVNAHGGNPILWAARELGTNVRAFAKKLREFDFDLDAAVAARKAEYAMEGVQ